MDIFHSSHHDVGETVSTRDWRNDDLAERQGDNFHAIKSMQYNYPTPKELSKRWNIEIRTAARTLKATYYQRIRTIVIIIMIIISITQNLESTSYMYLLCSSFYVRRYPYALLISLKCSWALNIDISFDVGSYLSWCFTFISLSVTAMDIGMLRISSESLLVYPTFSGS